MHVIRPALDAGPRATRVHAPPSPSRPHRPGTPAAGLLLLQRTAGNAAVVAALAGRVAPVVVQRTTGFEPLAGFVYEIRGTWHGFRTSQGGWHVSIFPVGPNGRRTFDEFHVTQEARGGNKHHFYTDDGHVSLNNLDNVALDDRAAWTIANRLAADFYQRRLNLHVTPEMLQRELDEQRRGGLRQTMQQHLAQAEAQMRTRQQAAAQHVPRGPEKEIDMFADSDEDEAPTNTGPVPFQQPPQPVPQQHVAQDPNVVIGALHQEYAQHAVRMAGDSSERYRLLSEAVDKLTVMFVQFQVANVAEMRQLYESTLRSLDRVDQ